MASVQIATTTDANGLPYTNARAFEKAGNRLWVLYNDGSNLVYRTSDDSGQTWSAATTVHTGSRYGTLVYDATNGRMEFFISGLGGGNEALQHRAITSNVTSGTPGALTTEIPIDSGGANLGCANVTACISPSVTNPRIFVVAQKYTNSTTRELRIWWCDAGTNTDTAINWTSGANVLGVSNSTIGAVVGRVSYQKIGGNDRVFVVGTDLNGGGTGQLKWILFDPTVASGSVATTISGATVRTGAVLGAGAGFDGFESTGNSSLYLASYSDAIVFGRRDRNAGTVGWYYTTDGITATAVTSGSITAGRSTIGTDGTDFHLVYSTSFGASASTAQALNYAKLTWSTKTLGSGSAFSDANGNGVQIPLNNGTTSLFVSYRGSTASAYSIRFDSVSISSDTTPPGLASAFTATPVSSGTEIDLAATMPSDSDMNQYEIRRLSGLTFPKTDRTDGTIIVAATATTPGAAVTFADTGLTGGTVYSYRLFNRDATGNWNTGTTVQATAATKPALSQRYKADGTTTVADGTTAAGQAPRIVFQDAVSDFKSGSVAHFRLRTGTNNAVPPTQNTFDLWSGDGSGIFEYETTVGSGTWTVVPGSGLPSAIHQRASSVKIRVSTPSSFAGQLYSVIRREQ